MRKNIEIYIHYQFGFNGQLKDNEIYGEGNAYTAEFWEYDPRSIRRWNVDPKPNISLSPYNCFAGNPIAFSDTRGDTLDIGNNAKSKSDIESIVKKENHQYLTFIDNRVGLDFGNLGNEERQNLLAEDEGLNLISDLINSNKKILYEASDYALIRSEDGIKVAGFLSRRKHNVINASEGGLDSRDARTDRPKEGYDGQVIIHPKTIFYERRSSGRLVKKRAAIVFHELAENYERTHGLVNYNGDNGAHNLANKREENWRKRSHKPGQVDEMDFTPFPSKKRQKEINAIMLEYFGYE